MTPTVTAAVSGPRRVGPTRPRQTGPVTGSRAVAVTVPVTRAGTVLSEHRLAGAVGLAVCPRGVHAASTCPAHRFAPARVPFAGAAYSHQPRTTGERR